MNSLKRKWIVGKCTSNKIDPCWCSWIGFADKGKDDDTDYVIPTGSVSTKEARHIVKLHNAWLKGKK